MLRLGQLYRARTPVQERVDEICQDLLKRYPATAYLAVLRGFQLVVLRRHEGWHPVRYIMEPGDTIPAFATAVGRALPHARQVGCATPSTSLGWFLQSRTGHAACMRTQADCGGAGRGRTSRRKRRTTSLPA